MRFRPAVVIALCCSLAWVGLVVSRVADRPASTTTGHPEHTLSDVAVPWPAHGQAALAVEGGGDLGASGGTRPVPIASLAKMMTAYLVLADHPLGDGARGFTVTFQDEDVIDWRLRSGDDQSLVRVEAGEVMDERQLLEALLLPSANNIAIVLAVHEAGSVAAFVRRMNETADDLGMKDTTYTDPSGLDAGTVSTAPDQLRLVRTALRDATFADIVSMPSTSLPVVGEVENTNPLLRVPGFLGVKTGSDDAAGGCLAFAAVRRVGGRQVTVLGVVLGQRGGPLLAAAGRAARPLAEAGFRAAGGTGSR
jgi:serine-type D-Ala-D-Ala carboxypeptidase (penicillin-binding protein 5/6)